MSVYKDTKNNTWKVYYRFTDWQGKVHQSTKRGFPTKREALAWEREQLHKVEADLDMTFESFIDTYTADMKNRLKENTWHTKEHIIRTKLLPYFAKRKMNSIQPKDIIAWQNEMIKCRDKSGETYSPVYLKTLHNQLSAIFNHAVKFYGLKDNPAAKVGNMGKAKAREMLFWTQDEYKKFSEEMMDKPVSFYAFEMLYWCGIREGELLALTPADFDFDRQTVTINKSYQRIGGRDIITDPKTPKSNRTIKMPEFLCEEIQDYMKQLYRIGKNDRLFEVTKSYLHHEMDRGAKAAGVKRIRIHDLRHPYVKPTTKIFSLRLMDFQAQAYPDAQRKTHGACQLHQGEQSRSSVRPLCNRKQFPCLSPQSKISRILYAISTRLSGYTSTRSISNSASSVVSVSALKIALDDSLRLSCRACSSSFCFACAITAA